jgi:hypothetical protein
VSELVGLFAAGAACSITHSFLKVSNFARSCFDVVVGAMSKFVGCFVSNFFRF